VKNLVGFKHLSNADQQRVEELLAGEKEQYALVDRPPLTADQFLPLLQRVLSSATSATDIATQQGQAAGYTFLMSHLRTICDNSSSSSSRSSVMGSPVPQVSVAGSTPHTVSTISTVTSGGMYHSAQSLTQDTSRSSHTPAQASSSLQADIVGSKSASTTSAAPVVREHTPHTSTSQEPQPSTAKDTPICATADVDEFVVVEEADKEDVERAVALDAGDANTATSASEHAPSKPSVSSTPAIPEEEPPVTQNVEPDRLPEPAPIVVQQRKHTRVIEAATALPEHTTDKKVLEDAQLGDKQATAALHSSDDSSIGSATSSSSSQEQHVLPGHAAGEKTTASATIQTSIGAPDRGSPATISARTSRVAHEAPAMQRLSDMLGRSSETHGGSGEHLPSTVHGAARSSAVTTSRSVGDVAASKASVPIGSTASAAKPHTTKTHAKTHSSTSSTNPASTANTTTAPQLTSLRQLLRQSTEQRRKVSNAVPRFNNSAASLHFSRLAQQERQEQQEQQL